MQQFSRVLCARVFECVLQLSSIKRVCQLLPPAQQKKEEGEKKKAVASVPTHGTIANAQPANPVRLQIGETAIRVGAAAQPLLHAQGIDVMSVRVTCSISISPQPHHKKGAYIYL
jgi:hypothetical protein